MRQFLCFLSKLLAFEVFNFKKFCQSSVEGWHLQYFLYLFSNPFVVSDWIGPTGNEEELKELSKSIIKTVERLEVQSSVYVERNMVEIVFAVATYDAKPLSAKRFIIIWQPFCLKKFQIVTMFPEDTV